jgi:hypothetical protein
VQQQQQQQRPGLESHPGKTTLESLTPNTTAYSYALLTNILLLLLLIGGLVCKGS